MQGRRWGGLVIDKVMGHSLVPSFARTVLLLLATGGMALSVHAGGASELLEARVREQTDNTLGGLVRDRRSSFAAAVLVHDGRLALAPAYGVEDLASTVPFGIDTTLIELNSVKKVFTAAAVAQLVAQGSITSIDDPVNRYLKHYKLPLAFGREVTIREVATHSAGLDETGFGAGALASDPQRYFAQQFPGYFRNPGRFSSYDSYGPKLLAYMVSELTGKPFSQYVDESILRPLAMDNTFLSAPATSLSHRVLSFQPSTPANWDPPSHLNSAGAAVLDGVAVSTMSDMAKFLMALLGPSADQNVITQRMRDVMFEILQSNGPRGSAHGLLFDAVRSGSKTLFVHGGVGAGIRCLLAIDLPESAGIFYCYGDVRTRFDLKQARLPPPYEQITDAMLKPFVACEGCTHYPVPAWNDAWKPYLGLYVDYARHHHGFSRLRTLMHPTTVRVERGAQSMRLDGKDGFVEIAPGTFGNPDYLETFSFIRNSETNKIILSVSDRPSAYERPSLLEDPRVLPRLLAVLVLIAASGVLLVLIPRHAISLRIRLAVAGYVAVVGCGVFALFGLSAFGIPYFSGIAWPLNIVRVCAFLTIPTCLVLIIVSSRQSIEAPRSRMPRWRRMHLGLVCVSAVLMVLTLLVVNLISFSSIT